MPWKLVGSLSLRMQPKSENVSQVEFKTCPLYIESAKSHSINNPIIAEKLKEFRATKQSNPIQNFGSKDYSMGANAPIGRAVPKIRHAHLTQDLSIFYVVEGRNPTLFKLYGVFSHAESGTGTPANIKRQQNFGKQLSHQVFTE